MRRAAWALVLGCVMLSACARAPATYYWGNYSESLYTAKKAPGEESLRAHKQVLANIIEESQRRALRVPPGVYCEYGYLLIQEGKAADGAKYLDLEAQAYPESKVFVERLKMQATGATGQKEQPK